MPPISPAPATGPRNGDLPAYVSNGLIGLRVREQPLMAGMTLVNGVAGEHWEKRVEAVAPVPYPLAGDISVDGVWLGDQPWSVTDLGQAYDFGSGELTSTFAFTARDIRIALEVLTFASRSAPSLVLQETRITAPAGCRIGFRARVDIADIRGRMLRRRTDTPGEDEPICDGSMLWSTEGDMSAVGIAMATECSRDDAARSISRWDATGPLVTEYSADVRKDRPIVFRQMVAMVPSMLHERPDEEASRRVARGRSSGFDTLRRRNRDAWNEIWKGRIVIHGADPRHQALIDAGLFYLNASTHAASPAATSMFGLATWQNYTYYFGHVMWDIDAFCVPPLILLQPDAALSMLDFRSRGLDAARSNARLSGRSGLQFPWEAAPLSGQEAAPGAGDSAAHEDHGSLHTARAFVLYADATGDEAYLKNDAWPVLQGVADWVMSRFTRTQRGFEILRSTGPAEVPVPPDNDAFTLMVAEQVVRRAIRAAEQTGRTPPPQWLDFVEHVFRPVRPDGVIPTHEDFRVSEPKGATPSPLAGLFPYDATPPRAVRDATLDFFLRHWSEYVGAPMLPALYPTWAAMAGDRELALKLFEEGYAAYDRGRFHQCLEYRPDHPDSQVAAGPFFANIGGMLMGLLLGLTGIVIDDGDPMEWPRRPVVLPQGWTAIEVERLWVRGRPCRLIAEHGATRARLESI